MFECDRDWDLIELMGEATRYESMSTAQRLLAVAELYERRQGALGDLEWYVVDYCAAVAAEVSAVQNISHARAVGQVQFACALAHRLPTVAKVFLRGHHRFADGVDDHRAYRQCRGRGDARVG